MLPNITEPESESDNKQTHDNVNTYNVYHCNICFLEFDTICRLPMIEKCGYMACLECSNLFLDFVFDNLCPFCKKKPIWSLNRAFLDVIGARMKEGNSTSCLHSTIMCNVPVEEKLICVNGACQNSHKIVCIPCYGLIHAGCKGKYIGNAARYYISNFRECYSSIQISDMIDVDPLNVLDKWKTIYKYENLLSLAVHFYYKSGYAQLDPSLITGVFLKKHFLINKNSINKEILYQVTHDRTSDRWLSKIDEENAYFFTGSFTKSSVAYEDASVFLNMFAERLSQIDCEYIVTNSNGFLKHRFGYVEKTTDVCFPDTIIREVRVFVFKLFKLVGGKTPDYFNNKPSCNESLTSRGGIEYTLKCHYFKTSVETEHIKNECCYFIESNYHQVVICVYLHSKGSIDKLDSRIHNHKSTENKRHLIRKVNK